MSGNAGILSNVLESIISDSAVLFKDAVESSGKQLTSIWFREAHNVVDRKNRKKVKFVIEGYNVLHLACAYNAEMCVKYILNHPDFCNEFANQDIVKGKSQEGFSSSCAFYGNLTPFELSVFMDHVECVQVLLQHGVYTLCEVQGYAPRPLWTHARSLPMVQLLVANGAVLRDEGYEHFWGSFISCKRSYHNFPVYDVKTFQYLVEECDATIDSRLLFQIFECMCDGEYGAAKEHNGLVQMAEIVRRKVGNDHFKRLAKFTPKFTGLWEEDCIYDCGMLQNYDGMRYWYKYLTLSASKFIKMIELVDEDGEHPELCPRSIHLLLYREPNVFNNDEWFEIAVHILQLYDKTESRAGIWLQRELCDIGRIFHLILHALYKRGLGGILCPTKWMQGLWSRTMSSVAAQFNPVPFIMLQAKMRTPTVYVERDENANGRGATCARPLL